MSNNEGQPVVKVLYKKKEGIHRPLKEHNEDVSSLNRLYEIMATCFEAAWFYDDEKGKWIILDVEKAEILLGDSSN